MFPLLERDAAEPARAVPDLAEPAGAPTRWSSRTSRCCGATTIPRRIVARRRRARDRGHGRRRASSARRDAAARRRPTRGRRAPTPTSRSGRSSMAPGATWTLPPAARRREPHALLLPRRAACAIGGRAIARRRTRSQLRADAPVALENGADESRAAAAAGPADRRAGRAARPVRDEHARGDPAGDRRLPAHAVRRLAVAQRRPGARARRGPVRAAAGRQDGTARELSTGRPPARGEGRGREARAAAYCPPGASDERRSRKACPLPKPPPADRGGGDSELMGSELMGSS